MTNKTAYVGPLYIEDEDLSLAWGRVVRHICDHTGREISPLIVSVTGFGDGGDVLETPEIRTATDALLDAEGQQSVEKVAFTIFPQRYWVMAQGDRAKLFSFYEKAFPRFKKMEPRKNANGLYFERLTMFDPKAPNEGNQLETIIERFNTRDGMQRMQLQATTYDPKRDQSGTAIQGFPCLQHVTFVPSSAGELTVNAFYATQQLFVRAYGNYLGLARLGIFMAHEMGLRMTRLNVFVGIEKLDDIAKTGEGISNIVNLVNEHRDEES